MTAVLVQFVLVLIAGAALYVLWRNVARHDRSLGIVVGVGIVGRSLLGQLIFWLSYLELVGHGLHIGNGIWFFAYDGYYYMQTAVQVAGGGPAAILTWSHVSAAATYVSVLSLFALLFGGSPAIGLFLNIFCYAGTCSLIALCARVTPEARRPASFAIIAVTFYPAGVLWSLQPLKDTLLHFLLVALTASALLWQRTWRSNARPLWLAAAFVGMPVSVYGITGSRWYLGLAVLGAVGIFLFLVLFTARQRRLALLGSSVVMFILSTQAFLYGGGDLIPPPMRRALSPMTARSNAGSFATAMVGYTEWARGKFERSGGATEIRLSRSTSPVARWGAGLLAIVLPHFVIEHLSFIRIDGGRGLFWFADLDTIVFDVVALTSLVMVLRRWRLASPSNALFWLVALTALFIMVPLLYTVTNFGALLRFRGMMYVPLALAPLAAGLGVSRSSPPPS